uniref:Uncharacterized protein n=1 Tax=Meloidogyne javanica TaxID=6303 RepID=A0A915LRA6_MELJA
PDGAIPNGLTLLQHRRNETVLEELNFEEADVEGLDSDFSIELNIDLNI